MKFDIEDWCHVNLKRVITKDHEIAAECPWCGRREGFNVNRNSGAFNCYKCSDVNRSRGRSIVGLVAEVEGKTWDEAREVVYGESRSPIFSGDISDVDEPDEDKGFEKIWLQLPPSEPVFDASRDPQWRFPKRLRERGITMEVAALYGLRVCFEGRFAKRLIIPVVSMLGRSFTARALTDDPVRYLNPDSAGHSKLLFGFDKIDHGADLVIVEGPFDVMKLRVHGIQAVALMGKSMSDAQEATLRLLLPSTSITLMLDPEEHFAQYEIARRLCSHFDSVRIAKLPEVDGKPIDPGDSTEEQALAALAASILYTGVVDSIQEAACAVVEAMRSMRMTEW